MAGLFGWSEVTLLLLEAGAGVHIKDKDGETPLDLATASIRGLGPPRFDVVKQLVEHGATFSSWDAVRFAKVCYNAIVLGDESLVELYLNNGCDPNGRPVRATPQRDAVLSSLVSRMS